MRRTILFAVLAAAAAFSSVSFADQQWRWSGAPRVVAVGDVHGAYSQLVGLLQANGVIDASLHWSGGDMTLVSVGDLIDRGPASRKVLDLMMRLQSEAAEHGGAVHVVLGNHEVMNLTGDLRYVSAQQYAEFAPDETSAMRDAAYARFVARQAQQGADGGTREAFDKRYPPGYFARQSAFRPDGRYGAWLLSLPVLIVVNDTAFVHGGLSPAFARMPGGELNRRIDADLSRYLAVRARLADAGVLPEADMERDLALAHAAQQQLTEQQNAALSDLLAEFIQLAEAPEFGIEGPLWYRGAIYCQPILAKSAVDTAVDQLGVARIVVGHTPTDDRRVRALYDGKLVTLDTGMLSSYFHGMPAALILEHGTVSVKYLGQDAPTTPEPGRLTSYRLDEMQLLGALAEDKATLEDGRSKGPAPATVEHDGLTLEATFYPQDRSDAAELELAAYSLDRLLDFGLVPPTVPREIDGRQGSLQLRYPHEISESERLERKLPIGESCPIEPQAQLMNIFETLTHDPSRTRDGIFYRRGLSVLTLSGYGRAFDTDRQYPDRLRDGALSVSPPVAAALESLTQQNLRAALGDWLDDKQIRALLARRDRIVARFSASADTQR